MSILTLVIPAFNEEQSLKKVLPSLLTYCAEKDYSVVIVNDGSTDGTATLLNQVTDPRLQVVHHKINRGYGGAIKSGICRAETEFCIMLDADGQHRLEDVTSLLENIRKEDSDMVVGRRTGPGGSRYRSTGRWLIRFTAGLLMKLPIHDLNSGMKIFHTVHAKKFLSLCPDSMAFSDVIALVFIHMKLKVTESDITTLPRTTGRSTINTMTAVETLKQILNIVILFNPMRVFFPMAVLFIVTSLAWGLPIVLAGRGVSVGAMLGITTGLILFFFGLIAEQLSQIRKGRI